MAKLGTDAARRRREAGLGPAHSEALARGLQILTAFDRTRPSLTLSEAAIIAGLPRATARRALLTLQALGYVSLDGRQFRLTPMVLRLATAYLTSNTVSVLLQPACDRLTALVGESSTAAVLEADEVVMVARALPSQLVPAGVGVGFRLPAHCSALGRVLLAALPDDGLAERLARMTIEAATPFTQTDPAAIHAAIRQAREQGYCFVDQEAEHGFRSIAVPLRRFDGTVLAALNIGARAERADAIAMTGPYLEALRVEATALSGALI